MFVDSYYFESIIECLPNRLATILLSTYGHNSSTLVVKSWLKSIEQFVSCFFIIVFSIRQLTVDSPGLVVTADDSCSKGRWFESRLHILDGYFSHRFVVKIVLYV